MTSSAVQEVIARVNSQYDSRRCEFDYLAAQFKRSANVPPDIIERAIKHRILKELNLNMEGKWLRRPSSTFVSIMNHLAVMGYLLFFSIFGISRKRQDLDLLVEGSGINFKEFYSPLLLGFPNRKVGVFGKYQADINGELERYPQRHQKWFFDRKVAWSIFRGHILSWSGLRRLSYRSDVDLNALSLIFCLEIAKHKSTLGGLNVSLLLSADDAAYPPLRYWAYKSSGIECVALIQNGGRVELDAHYSAYISCDIFFAWSEHRLKNFLEISCEQPVVAGSMRLSKFNSNSKEIFSRPTDLLFVEQIFARCSESHRQYLRFLENLIQYSKDRPTVRVGYATRPLEDRLSGDKNSKNEIDNLIKTSEVLILSSTTDARTYKHIVSTSLVIAYDSSIRLEAITMGKPVVSCSDGPRSNDYVSVFSPEQLNIEDVGYCNFAEKLDALLDNGGTNGISYGAKQQNLLGFKNNVDSHREIVSKIAKVLNVHDIAS